MPRGWSITFWVLWGCLMASWILALAGLASLQNNCYDNPDAALAQASGVQGFTTAAACSSLYRLYWWYIAFVFALLIGTLVTAASGWLVASALSWAAWAAALSALLTLASDAFLSLRDVANVSQGGVWWSRASTAAAGFVLMTIFALALAFILAWRVRRGAGAGGGGGGGAGPIKF